MVLLHISRSRYSSTVPFVRKDVERIGMGKADVDLDE
jgi:hypothetical protein